MGKRKSRGNPLTKGVGKLLHKAGAKVGDEALGGIVNLATGSTSTDSSSKSSSQPGTDWATRIPAPPRSRTKRSG